MNTKQTNGQLLLLIVLRPVTWLWNKNKWTHFRTTSSLTFFPWHNQILENCKNTSTVSLFWLTLITLSESPSFKNQLSSKRFKQTVWKNRRSVLDLINSKREKPGDLVHKPEDLSLILCTLVSVCTFSILFFTLLLRCWHEEFVL